MKANTTMEMPKLEVAINGKTIAPLVHEDTLFNSKAVGMGDETRQRLEI
jgi:hypothetical protein